MVLKLLKNAKSAMKNFDQSEATFGSHMTTMDWSDWSKFFIADLAYMSNSKTILPLVNFDLGIILKKNSPKTHFWGPFHKFFSRILNNSLKKWDFIQNMSMPKVENQKLREQKMFSKNGQ